MNRAGYVPAYEPYKMPEPNTDRLSITVAALKKNKRPVGFSPWPEPPKKKRKKKGRAA